MVCYIHLCKLTDRDETVLDAVASSTSHISLSYYTQHMYCM